MRLNPIHGCIRQAVLSLKLSQPNNQIEASGKYNLVLYYKVNQLSYCDFVIGDMTRRGGKSSRHCTLSTCRYIAEYAETLG